MLTIGFLALITIAAIVISQVRLKRTEKSLERELYLTRRILSVLANKEANNLSRMWK